MIITLTTFLLRPTFEYLDPSSGSIIIQMVAAALLGGAFALKLGWKRIKKFFAQITNKSMEPENPNLDIDGPDNPQNLQ